MVDSIVFFIVLKTSYKAKDFCDKSNNQKYQFIGDKKFLV
ncbi:hypothetical protein HMPREF0693_2927 [Proteus mirabilis ATCC 29906]|nr:hypothetical protein HMPREF0693_2927 [Proteus mirabilis ATCC 29906]KXC01146.1 hypothetical protein HMPREF3203_01347 [Proteus mirabilis]PVF73262.1 hypothetical protein CSC14_2656 [Proteus mirabilis]